MWDKQYIEELKYRREKAFVAGGKSRIDRQHNAGKLTARERIDLLFDPGTFNEIGTIRETNSFCGNTSSSIVGDGVITGYGRINGQIVYVASQDFTVNGGTLGETHSLKICRVMDLAYDTRCPFVSINDSGGARIEEGIKSLNGYSGIFYRNTKASGVIPQISVIMGPCAGGACYSPAICDFVFMVNKTSQMFITGPLVVREVTGETTDPNMLGGSDVHTKKTGVAHFSYENDRECLEGVRTLLNYLPQNNDEKPKTCISKVVDNSGKLEEIVPDDMRKSYDVHAVIDAIVDKSSFFEVSEKFAPNVVVGFSRIDGEVIGIVANQPCVIAGTLDVDASDKAARFVRFCDCFNIPILSLVDVPGYLPGSQQEHEGIIRHGAKLLYAFSEATVPKVCLVMRKAFGGAYIAMNSKNMGADYVFAWPIAQLAVMGAEGAIDILYKKELEFSEDKANKRNELIKSYEEKYLNPYTAASNGYIDDVIEAAETRKRISAAFASLKTKKQRNMCNRKHGNIPL